MIVYHVLVYLVPDVVAAAPTDEPAADPADLRARIEGAVAAVSAAPADSSPRLLGERSANLRPLPGAGDDDDDCHTLVSCHTMGRAESIASAGRHRTSPYAGAAPIPGAHGNQRVRSGKGVQP